MKVLVNGVETELTLDPDVQIVEQDGLLRVRTSEGSFTALAVKHKGNTYISYRGRSYKIEKAGSVARGGGGGKANGSLLAPMPGQVVDVLVEEGQQVNEGQRLLVLEAMKTQQPVLAPFAGTVERLPVAKGQQVSDGELLAKILPHPGPE